MPLPRSRCAAALRLLPLCVVVLSGCATAAAVMAAPDRQALLLSDRPAPRASCTISYTPAALPPLLQLADSAALARAVAAFTREERIGDGEMHTVFSVAYDRDGRVERVKAIDWWMPEGAAERMEGVVRAHLKRQPAGPGSSVRLRVDPGTQPGFRVGRSERCRPESRMSFRLETPQAIPLEKPETIRMRVLVGAEGGVIGSDLLRGSGNGELDRWVTQTLARYRYAPGLIDGVPVQMEYEQSVAILARR